MKSFISKLMVLAFMVLLVSSASAAEKEKKKQDGKRAAGPIGAVEKQVAELKLSDEQKTKVSAILNGYKPKFEEAQAKAQGNLTAEQKKARKEAAANVKADGKKGKEAKAEVEAAVKLTDEQKKNQQVGAAALKELQASLKKDLAGVLSEEQVAKLGLEGKRKKKDA